MQEVRFFPLFLEQCATTLYALGHDFLHKSFGLMNDKAPSVRLPRDNVRKALRFGLFQYQVQFERKGQEDTASFALEHRGFGRCLYSGIIVIVMLHKVTGKLLGRVQ